MKRGKAINKIAKKNKYALSLTLILVFLFFAFSLSAFCVNAVSIYTGNFGFSQLAKSEMFSFALLFVFFFVLLLTPISKVISQYPFAVIASVIISIFASVGLTAKYGSLLSNPIVLAIIIIVALFIIMMRIKGGKENLGLTFLVLSIAAFLTKYFLCDKFNVVTQCSAITTIGVILLILAIISFLIRLAMKVTRTPTTRIIQPRRPALPAPPKRPALPAPPRRPALPAPGRPAAKAKQEAAKAAKEAKQAAAKANAIAKMRKHYEQLYLKKRQEKESLQKELQSKINELYSYLSQMKHLEEEYKKFKKMGYDAGPVVYEQRKVSRQTQRIKAEINIYKQKLRMLDSEMEEIARKMPRLK